MAEDNQNNDQPQTEDELMKKVEEAKVADEVQQTEDLESNELVDMKEALARCMADLQNFKRRAEEDKMKFVKFANAELLKKLLPIIDNFDRGCQQLPEELVENAWAKGIVSSHDELMKALDQIGVKKMETVGQKLDPNKHEAVMQAPGEKDTVLEEFEPGYELNGEVLKPAKVQVGSGE